jgi:hypothetical protein
MSFYRHWHKAMTKVASQTTMLNVPVTLQPGQSNSTGHTNYGDFGSLIVPNEAIGGLPSRYLMAQAYPSLENIHGARCQVVAWGDFPGY